MFRHSWDSQPTCLRVVVNLKIRQYGWAFASRQEGYSSKMRGSTASVYVRTVDNNNVSSLPVINLVGLDKSPISAHFLLTCRLMIEMLCSGNSIYVE